MVRWVEHTLRSASDKPKQNFDARLECGTVDLRTCPTKQERWTQRKQGYEILTGNQGDPWGFTKKKRTSYKWASFFNGLQTTLETPTRRRKDVCVCRTSRVPLAISQCKKPCPQLLAAHDVNPAPLMALQDALQPGPVEVLPSVSSLPRVFMTNRKRGPDPLKMGNDPIFQGSWRLQAWSQPVPGGHGTLKPRLSKARVLATPRSRPKELQFKSPAKITGAWPQPPAHWPLDF